MKEFVAEFRSIDPLGGPKILWKILRASSEKEARIVGKGLAGREDELKWFFGIQRELTDAYRRGEVKI